MIKCLHIILFILLFTLTSKQENEYGIKAAYIEKFARFTNWDYEISKDTFYITVLGQNPFKNELDNLATNYTIHEKKIEINYIEDINDLENTNLLFIASSEDANLNSIGEKIRDKNILVIGETEKCVKMGGHFVFFINDDETIGFKVNPRKIKEAGLNSDIYLMSFGEVIK